MRPTVDTPTTHLPRIQLSPARPASLRLSHHSIQRCCIFGSSVSSCLREKQRRHLAVHNHNGPRSTVKRGSSLFVVLPVSFLRGLKILLSIFWQGLMSIHGCCSLSYRCSRDDVSIHGAHTSPLVARCKHLGENDETAMLV